MNLNLTGKEIALHIREHNKIHQRKEPLNSPIITEILEVAAVLFEKIDAGEYQVVKHAHWIEKTDWYHGIGRIHCTCSNCGYTVDYKPGSRGDGRGGKFCDDCGAKMDGGEQK